jgi:hypothetical protein
VDLEVFRSLGRSSDHPTGHRETKLLIQFQLSPRSTARCLKARESGGLQRHETPRPLARTLWGNPDCFDPERFAPERAALRPRYAYIPFGAGPRICIGAAFAMAEAMVILATIAQRYRLRVKPGFPVEPQGLITLRPRYGLRMSLERRTDVKAVT